MTSRRTPAGQSRSSSSKPFSSLSRPTATKRGSAGAGVVDACMRETKFGTSVRRSPGTPNCMNRPRARSDSAIRRSARRTTGCPPIAVPVGDHQWQGRDPGVAVAGVDEGGRGAAVGALGAAGPVAEQHRVRACVAEVVQGRHQRARPLAPASACRRFGNRLCTCTRSGAKASQLAPPGCCRSPVATRSSRAQRRAVAGAPRRRCCARGAARRGRPRAARAPARATVPVLAARVPGGVGAMDEGDAHPTSSDA